MADTAHVAVTGAGGYLGWYVAGALVRPGVTVHALLHRQDVDLLSEADTEAWVGDLPYRTTLVHCAAVVPKTLDDYHDADAAMDNMLMVKNLLEAVAVTSYPIRRLVFISSLTACREDTRYAQGKCFAEQMVERADDPEERITLRLPGLFGAPRTSGHVYDTIKREGECPPPSWPVMWVQDAAECVARVALFSGEEGVMGGYSRYSVTYANRPFQQAFGDLGVTVEQRLDEYATLLANNDNGGVA